MWKPVWQGFFPLKEDSCLRVVKSFQAAVMLLPDVGKILGSRKKIRIKVLLNVVRWIAALFFSRLNSPHCSIYFTRAQQSLISSFLDTFRISGLKVWGVPTAYKESRWHNEVASRNTNSKDTWLCEYLKTRLQGSFPRWNEHSEQSATMNMWKTANLFQENAQFDTAAFKLCKVRSQNIKWDKEE